MLRRSSPILLVNHDDARVGGEKRTRGKRTRAKCLWYIGGGRACPKHPVRISAAKDQEIEHIDGDPNNCSLDNLRIRTRPKNT